uniref:RNA 3'-terminal phosphate cyclase n=1 Tax=Arcella intermedia TaxID=1963864 RepID=A0A6B2L7X8_9EUKA
MSILMKKPVAVSNIRAKRAKPGLAAQHLTGIKLVSQMCKGSLRGGTIGSTTVSLHPGALVAGDFEADIGTAGSVGLLIQISFPCMIFGPGPYSVTYKGGTDAIMAPQLDYFSRVFKPFVSKFGIDFEIELVRRGFYPRGGGLVRVRTNPVTSLSAITVEERGDIVRIDVYAFCSGAVPENVPKRMSDSAVALLKKNLDQLFMIDYHIHLSKETQQTAFGDGTAIMICAQSSTGCILAGSSIGEKGKKAENVGEEAANHLLKDISYGGCTDEYLQDQIIIFMALAEGNSKVKVGPISEHTSTSIHYTGMLTGAKFTVTPTQIEKEHTFWLECSGIGFKRNN